MNAPECVEDALNTFLAISTDTDGKGRLDAIPEGLMGYGETI